MMYSDYDFMTSEIERRVKVAEARLRDEYGNRSELYLSDRDRERISDELREHYATGRITFTDLERRLARVWTRPLTQRRVNSIMAHLPGSPVVPA